MNIKESKFLKLKQNWILNQKKINPNASNEILHFIQEFLFKLYSEELPNDAGQTLLQQQFTQGYCWHFANILKTTFNRGVINVIAPNFNHIIWTDTNDISYDINGIINFEAILVPEIFLKKYYPKVLNNFKHNGIQTCEITDELIDTIVNHWFEFENQNKNLK